MFSKLLYHFKQFLRKKQLKGVLSNGNTCLILVNRTANN